MKINWLTIKMALLNLNAHRLRSFLTMLGIVIGIASVISIVSLGAGAQSLITNALKNLGTDLVTVLPGNSNDTGPPASALGILVTTLTEEDADAIAELPGVVSVTGFSNGSGNISFLKRSTQGSYSGVDANYPTVGNHEVVEGRFFTDEEARSMKNVVVLGDDIRTLLFPLSDPIGEKIKIQNESFTVIGVMDRKGSTLFENMDNRVFIPLGVSQTKLTGNSHLSSIDLLVEDESQIEGIKEMIRNLLRVRHNIQDPENDDFSVRSVTQALDVFTGVTDALSAFLAVIAGVSLVIGGISVVNIMLMTVKERTKEIGLRKALGATPKRIQNQFLIETMVITFIGGVLGLISGLFFSLMVALLMRALEYNWSYVVDPIAVLVSVVASAFIGLLFGVVPARKAAALNPIEALRYE